MFKLILAQWTRFIVLKARFAVIRLGVLFHTNVFLFIYNNKVDRYIVIFYLCAIVILNKDYLFTYLYLWHKQTTRTAHTDSTYIWDDRETWSGRAFLAGCLATDDIRKPDVDRSWGRSCARRTCSAPLRLQRRKGFSRRFRLPTTKSAFDKPIIVRHSEVECPAACDGSRAVVLFPVDLIRNWFSITQGRSSL